jgi:hypothetical protein
MADNPDGPAASSQSADFPDPTLLAACSVLVNPRPETDLPAGFSSDMGARRQDSTVLSSAGAKLHNKHN